MAGFWAGGFSLRSDRVLRRWRMSDVPEISILRVLVVCLGKGKCLRRCVAGVSPQCWRCPIWLIIYINYVSLNTFKLSKAKVTT